MQTLDAESEVKRTARELSALRDDLNLEEKEIGPEGAAVEPVIIQEENGVLKVDEIAENPRVASDGLFD